MAALYRLGEATAAEVVADGVRHMYRPVVARRRAGRTAAKGLIRAFFPESPSEAVLTLLDLADRKLTPKELDVITARIDEARRGKE